MYHASASSVTIRGDTGSMCPYVPRSRVSCARAWCMVRMSGGCTGELRCVLHTCAMSHGWFVVRVKSTAYGLTNGVAVGTPPSGAWFHHSPRGLHGCGSHWSALGVYKCNGAHGERVDRDARNVKSRHVGSQFSGRRPTLYWIMWVAERLSERRLELEKGYDCAPWQPAAP